MPPHLFILGAGFSHNAGLPLAGEFTKRLLTTGQDEENTSRRIVEYLRNFVDTTFANGARTEPENWPPLEDIFTLVDLSANTGHHLGPRFSPADLRTGSRRGFAGNAGLG